MQTLIEELRCLLREARPLSVDKGQIKHFAARAVQQFHRFFSRPPKVDLPLGKQTWSLPFGTYKTTDVAGRPVSAELNLTSKEPTKEWSPRRWVTGGSMNVLADPTGKEKRILTISLMANRTPRELLAHLHEVEEEINSVLLHEVTHLMDVLKHAKPKAGTAEYYNDPPEIKAFLQQINHEVLAHIHALGKEDGGWLFVGPPSADFVHSALDNSPTWERIRRHLTKDNEKYLLRAISRSITDEWPHLRKLYPDDDED